MLCLIRLVWSGLMGVLTFMVRVEIELHTERSIELCLVEHFDAI